MRVLHTLKLFLAYTFATLICAPAVFSAKEPPVDICALLPTLQLQKVFGQTFGTPERSAAPAAYRGQPVGTECDYKGREGEITRVVFIDYVDPSAAQAKETYEKLSAWFIPKTKPAGVGDSAYIDKEQAIHVLKGRVRYYIKIISSGAAVSEKQLIDIASWVASQI